jgi:peptide/nickel transport system substrate-binding protein
VGVAAAARTGGAADKPVLTVGFTQTPISEDPAKDGGGWTTFRTLTHTSLIKWAWDGSLQPGLATKWGYFKTAGGPNTGFQLTLRPNVKFSNGEPLNAAAVKKWLLYFPTGKGSFAGLLSIKSIQTVGDLGVRITLKKPNPGVPMVLTEIDNWGFVSAPAAVANPKLMETNTYGVGPYVLSPSDTVNGDHYTYVPNPQFYDQSQVHWSKVVVKVIPSASTMVQALKTGQIQAAWSGDVQTLSAIGKTPGFKVVQAPTLSAGPVLDDFQGTLAPALANLNVRKALNYAIDRKTIGKALYGSYAVPSAELFTLDGTDPGSMNAYPYSVAKAKALLAAAGYKDGFTLSVLSCSCFGTFGVPMDQAVAKYWAAIGVKVNITTDTTVNQWLQQLATKKFAVADNVLGASTMATAYSVYLTKGGVLNPFGLTDSTIDKLFSASLVSPNAKKLWQKITARMVQQAYQAPVAFIPSELWAASNKLGNVKMSIGRPRAWSVEWYPVGA